MLQIAENRFNPLELLKNRYGAGNQKPGTIPHPILGQQPLVPPLSPQEAGINPDFSTIPSNGIGNTNINPLDPLQNPLLLGNGLKPSAPLNSNTGNTPNSNNSVASETDVQGKSIATNTQPGTNNNVAGDVTEITKADLENNSAKARELLEEGRFKEERRRLDEVQNTLDNQFKLRDKIASQDPEEAYRRKMGGIDSAMTQSINSALRGMGGPLSGGSFNTGAIEAGARAQQATQAAMPLAQMKGQAADAVDAQRNALTQQEQYQDLNIANNAYGHTDFLDRSYNALEDTVLGGAALTNYMNSYDIDGNSNNVTGVNSISGLTDDEKAAFNKMSPDQQATWLREQKKVGR